MQTRKKRTSSLGGASLAAAVLTTAGIVALVAAPSATAASLTVAAGADTYAHSANPGTNYGTSMQLVVDKTPAQRPFVLFDVIGITEAVTSAKLRLHVADVTGADSTNGGTWKAVSNTTWTETGVTWNNQPAIDGSTSFNAGKVTRNTWVEIDVTSAITTDGTYAFGATSNSTNDAIYDSRETANDPQLVITTADPTPTATTPTPTATTPPPGGGDPILVGAGDIAGSGTGDTKTSDILRTLPSDATVFAAGDNAYNSGTLGEYMNYYDPTWGFAKSRTIPAPGNHEYGTSGAAGYFDYFGALAGPNRNGWFSKDVGDWHVISLNSEVNVAAGSPQEQWLRADLAANTKACTVAMWHSPLFTSGSHSPDSSLRPLFQALYDYNADLVLTGHNHNYERFAPMKPDGTLDPVRGIREFVAGMGGASHYNFTTNAPNSEARNSDTWGVLKLTLHANSYDWEFLPEAGKSYNDHGTGTCH